MRKIKDDSSISASKLTKEVEVYIRKNVNLETIKMARKQNFRDRAARNNSFASEENRKKGLHFLNKDFDLWKETIFTDKSKFNIFHSDGKFTV